MVPVVDVSKWQGAIHFPTMRARNVAGLIIRATHGPVEDPRLVEYVTQALDAGYAESDLGFYTFCNPKRSSGAEAARFFVHAVRGVMGHTDTFLMLDVENYTNESGHLPPLGPADYADWLRDMVATLRAEAPDARLVIYTNAAYWNPNVGARDFGAIDIIVARYPYYSPGAPKPPADADQWAGWIMAQPKRPVVPVGWDTWDGWQFSAGHNAAGATYGASSADLDLNIVHAAAWARWTATTTTPPVAGSVSPLVAAGTGDGAMLIIGRKEQKHDPKRWVYNGQVKSDPTEAAARVLVARGMTHGTTLENPEWWTDAEIAAVPSVVPDQALA